ncbi:hypothetical protein C7S18_04025 [Ahniella affigens]|uniref:DUF304 domain-containing protein n=1 Tax=Ahniella affigens TaxID=2021234 RepID=A0A2P1PNJ3_9GAMM|nr:hypothetical protein [Ahniella affigens]AVP96411.1 hypothetical protein C7S18_04025 [Ahniella affigens]
MNHPPLRQFRTSGWLYIYQYATILILCGILARFIGPWPLYLGLTACLYLFARAKTRQSRLFADRVEVQVGVLSSRQITLHFKDVMYLVIADRTPWRQLGLGSVILALGTEDDECEGIISVPGYMELAEEIRRMIVATGREDVPMYVAR